jgi:hypothetical protein
MTTDLRIALHVITIVSAVSGVLLGWALRGLHERRRANMNRITQRKNAGDFNVAAIVSGGHTWIFLFREDKRAECLRTLGRFASDHKYPFTWYDAARLSQAIRKG